MDTILTCDNGIAAISEIAHAKELGMTVLVTDHHEIPYIEENGKLGNRMFCTGSRTGLHV
jgi:single-stranded-DNA-specific exonuclease